MRTKWAGWLAVLTLLTYLISLTDLFNIIVSAVFAWLTMIVMWPSLRAGAKKQSIVFFTLGTLMLIAAHILGYPVLLQEAFSTNTGLLSMFIAISFLGLTNPPDELKRLPIGTKALLTTSAGINVLGALLNLSILLVFGDRLQRQGQLQSVQQIVLARSFTAAAWWSPFFVATGVALLYSPEMEWRSTLTAGFAMALISLLFTNTEAILKRTDKTFEGYPLRLESLMLPGFLAVAVITTHSIWPHLSVLLLIIFAALSATFIFMTPRPRIQSTRRFIETKLLSTATQFSLFLAAGVFSTALKTLILQHPQLLPLASLQFDENVFAACLGFAILLGIIGVHPIVSIAFISPLLLPLAPDPNSLGFMFLSIWAISTGSSPLSGVGLVMSSRYHINPLAMIKNNWYYALAMWACACSVNWLFYC